MEFVLNLNWVFLLLPLLFCIIFFFKWFFSVLSPVQKRLPPSPPKLPIIGNFHQIGLFPHRSLQSLSKTYGPLMMLSFGSKHVLVACSADAAREILKHHDLVFSSRPKSTVIEKLMHGSLDVDFAPYCEHWRQLKSICVLQLLSNKRVQSFRHIREEETSRMIEKIRQKCSSSSSSSLNLSEIFVTVTNNVITKITTGRSYSDWGEESNIVTMFEGYSEISASFNVADYIPWLAWENRFNCFDAKVETVVKVFDDFMDAVIKEHHNRKKADGDTGDTNETRGSDFVDILLDVQKGNFTSFPLDLATIKAVLTDMIGAGTETTEILLDWAMVELVRNPKISEKLQTEVRKAVQGKTEVTEEDLQRMPYLKAVLKET